MTWPRAVRRSALVVLLVGLIGGAVARPAAGQQPQASQRPYRGLFGGAAGSSSVRSLDFTASLFAGFDDDIFARGSGPRPEDQRLSGTFAGTQAGLAYGREFATSAFRASASTSLRWLTSTGEFVPTGYGASLGYTKSLSARTSLALAQSAAYNPRFSAVPFTVPSTIGPSLPGDAGGSEVIDGSADVGGSAPGDFAIAASRNAVLYAGSVQLGRALSPRSNLSINGGYRVTDFGSADASRADNRRYNVGGRYTYALTSYLSGRLGYGYRTFRLPSGATNDNHDIDVGLDFGRPFTFGTGRTRLTFATGTTMLVRERLTSEGGTGDRFILRAVGSAALTHQFTAPWHAQLAYNRSIGYLDGLSEAYEGDQVTASLGGFVGRRTDIMMSAGYVSGAAGVRERNFNTALASLRARLALTTSTALFVQYFYYQFDYAESVASQLSVPPSLERQGVRVGLTVWVPLLR